MPQRHAPRRCCTPERIPTAPPRSLTSAPLGVCCCLGQGLPVCVHRCACMPQCSTVYSVQCTVYSVPCTVYYSTREEGGGCTLRNMAARMTRACAMKIGLGNYPEVVAQRPAALPCQSTRRTATIGDLCTADQRGEAREGRTCHPRASLLMRSNTGAWPKHWGGRYHTPHATPPSRRSQRLLYE